MSNSHKSISHTIRRPTLGSVTIREASPTDRAALERLAQLDSSDVPAGRLLLAESAGELRAALSLTSGQAIADPFHRTAELVALLRARAEQAAPGRSSRARTVVRTPAPAVARG